MTGEVIRACRSTALRYERARPGELVHVDVKKLGRIPDGGGWRATGEGRRNHAAKRRVGFDYVHSMVDDHSRFASQRSWVTRRGHLRGLSRARDRGLQRKPASSGSKKS